MPEKLKEQEVLRIVAEVSKLDEERRQMLDKEQVRQILRELNLSDDLLDEAIQKLEEGRLVEKKKQKIFSTVLVVGIAIAVIGLATLFMTSSYNDQLSRNCLYLS